MLGAAGLGDIGSHFGTGEPEWANAAGVEFLRETAQRVRAAGWSIGNVSVQAIGNRPKIAARREQAEETLSAALGASGLAVGDDDRRTRPDRPRRGHRRDRDRDSCSRSDNDEAPDRRCGGFVRV